MPHEMWRTVRWWIPSPWLGFLEGKEGVEGMGLGGEGEEIRARLQPALKHGVPGQRPGQWEGCQGGEDHTPLQRV